MVSVTFLDSHTIATSLEVLILTTQTITLIDLRQFLSNFVRKDDREYYGSELPQFQRLGDSDSDQDGMPDKEKEWNIEKFPAKLRDNVEQNRPLMDPKKTNPLSTK